MNAIVLLLILFSLFKTGKFQTAQPQLIEVQEGDNHAIRCQSHPTIDLENYTLDVKRVHGNASDTAERVVYSRRHGKDNAAPQMEQYRNRVFSVIEDLRVGVLTVVIHSVHQSDSGAYKCYIPRLKSASFFTLVVKAKQNGIEENDFTTMATLMEETMDAAETGAATKNHHRHYRITVGLFCLVGVVLLVLFIMLIKGTWGSRRGCGGNDNEPETPSVQAKEGDEEAQLKNPSAGGVGELAG